tara:strand:- start:217 stop:567 length:351 start_codon:yes stop_codon:yes gene_type:complete
MTNRVIPLLLILNLVFGQSHFNDKWYKVGTNWQVYIYIYETPKGQFLEQYLKISDGQNLLFKKKIIKPWIGSSYTKTEYLGKSYNSKLKLIDNKTILYGQEVYKKYVLPNDFLKGN